MRLPADRESGERLTPLARACPSCRTVAAPASRFCAQCGARLGAAENNRGTGPASGERVRGLGERRQVTVLFCDLVDSTATAARLDPEEMCELMRMYQSICAEAIGPFEGYIAQTLGDGLLVYFGYPEAHEDDAERAARAGLAIATAVSDPQGMLRRNWGECSVRVGIHTGLVVAGEIGRWDTRADMAITGETPNIAARLQQLAGNNEVVIGPKTQRLIEGYFQLEAMGPQPIKGLREPLPVWRVRRVTRPGTRFAARSGRTDMPLLGREAELSVLLERWNSACKGAAQSVTVAGAAGIGKSRLLSALHAQIEGQLPYRLQYQCSPFFQNSPLYPVIAQLQHAACIRPHDAPVLKLRKLERLLAPASLQLEHATALIGRLLEIADFAPGELHALSPQRLLDDTVDALVEQVVRLAELRPVLIVIEDAHWIDPTTRSLIARCLERGARSRLLIVVTHRPDAARPYASGRHVTELTLERLGREQSQAIVRHLAEAQRLPSRVIEEIISRGDGIPLFVEELTKAVLESDAGNAPLRVPLSLQDSLTARLDRIGPLKFVAQLGACIGRSFLYELLATVAQLDEGQLRDGLDRLVVAELLSQRGDFPEAMFTFRHALLQNAAYDSMLRTERRVMHAAIARCMVSERRGSEHPPEVVAQHLTAAGDHEAAIEYWLRAGQLAEQRSAHSEAVAHLNAGLDSLRQLPASVAVDACEIQFRTALARSFMPREGWSGPRVSASYRRARALCRSTGNGHKECEVLWGLWATQAVSGDLAQASILAGEYVALAESLQDAGAILMAHSAAVITRFALGEFAQAQRHAQLIHAEYRAERDRDLAHVFNHDPVAIASMFEGFWLWVQGYPERAARATGHSVEHARRLRHPFQLCYALMNGSGALLLGSGDGLALAHLDEGLQLASEHRFPMFPIYGALMAAPAVIRRDPSEAALERLRLSLENLRAADVRLHLPFYLLNLAAAYEQLGHMPEAAALVLEGLELGSETGECWVQPELCRARARLLLSIDRDALEPAEQWLVEGRSHARRLGARAFELRIACDQAEIWQRRGQPRQAREALESLHAWFSEGTGTPDLRRARQLLQSLA